MQILNPTPSAVYNGMIQGTYRIATGEGILSLWRGMSSVVVGAGSLHAGNATWPHLLNLHRTGPCRLLCDIRSCEASDGGK